MTAPYFDFPAEALPTKIQHRTYADHGKRLFDLTLLLVLAPMIVPALALMVAATWAAGGKPLYTQQRIGLNGRTFVCWKIRTMVRDADGALQRILAEDARLALEWAVNQKLSRDPRITLLGRFLRKTSLDELPQVWNVLRGDMSLVGPRPFTPEQRALYPSDEHGHTSYFELRPGITGLWQTCRRNAGSFAERAHYDMAYARSLSFKGDLRILFRTVFVVLRATGI